MTGPGTGDLEDLGLPPSAETALAALAEPVADWFRHAFGEPTPVQRLAWPAVAAGKSVLLGAPTGSGKTLAALLPVLSRLLKGPVAAGIACLVVAPLKALAADARKSLRRHLAALRPFLAPGCGKPRVGLRTGDTPARVRRALQRHPPDILVTTPESLAVMLSQPSAAGLFAGLAWIVLDEIHALAGSKRGADLALSLERLSALAGGGLQRIGLTATCAPAEEAARFLAGTGRPCAIGRVAETAPLELTVEPLEEEGRFLERLLARLEPELTANRTTLVFTNVRSLAERLTWALGRRFPAWAGAIAVHHSALAAGRRRTIERRLKQGQLRAVVSSTSLELGIDMGPVDGVVLVHPPGGVVRLLQRVGRGGHGPGRPRRGLVLTATAGELLEAAVTAAAGRAGQYEPLRVANAPLDVLCQQLLGMAAGRPWSAAEAFDLVRRAYPYRDLPWSDLHRCLDYLSGRHADGRAWLPARLRWQGEAFRVRDERTARLLRRNLGTILTEAGRTVRLRDGPAVGEVAEGFADRLQPGDRFLLDGRCLEFCQSEEQTLLVEEVAGYPRVPRWGGEGWPLAPELARRLYVLRFQAAGALRDGPQALAALLHDSYGLGERAAASLVAHFQRQECVSEVPEPAACLVEAVAAEAGMSYYLHTPLNRAGNDALARVVVRRLARDRGWPSSSVVADLGLVLLLRRDRELAAAEWRTLLRVEAFDADLAEALAGSLALRERFRRVAQTGLMLLRNPLGRRRRVGGQTWAERRLFEQVRAADPEFVLLQQAQREVSEACCDREAARAFAAQVPFLTVRCRRLAWPSPFAEAWTQQTAGPADAVESPAEVLQRLHATLNSR